MGSLGAGGSAVNSLGSVMSLICRLEYFNHSTNLKLFCHKHKKKEQYVLHRMLETECSIRVLWFFEEVPALFKRVLLGRRAPASPFRCPCLQSLLNTCLLSKH